jgi:hypothetical protein
MLNTIIKWTIIGAISLSLSLLIMYGVTRMVRPIAANVTQMLTP